MFINIHTHHPRNNEEWSILSLHANFETIHSLSYYSTGIHPCYIEAYTIEEEMNKMKISSTANNVLAIGECGLDRICGVDFKLQEKVFIEQILWANEIAKPLIIHCVRAHREIIQLLKEHNRIAPVIFHGFNNNIDIANDIVSQGYYLSFGKSLFNPHEENVFAAVSNEKIFLETDDSELPIDAVFKQAAKIKNTSAEQLNNQIQKNVQKVFNLSL